MSCAEGIDTDPVSIHITLNLNSRIQDRVILPWIFTTASVNNPEASNERHQLIVSQLLDDGIDWTIFLQSG